MSQSAAADEAPAAGDIVVTAQKRNQNLQDVGVSVTALVGTQLKELGITSAKDISKAVPGLLLDSGSGGGLNALLTIRGISQSDFSSTQESPNSIYIDDVYLSSSNAAAFTLFDMERTEVLRGPQGTLFGRASSGGLVNFITRKPSTSFEGYAEVGYGRFNNVYGEAAVGGPLSDKIRFRLSGRAERHDGWYENKAPGGKDTFEGRFYGVRGQVEADLTDNLKARASLSYDKNPRHREGAYKSYPWYIGADGQPAPVPANLDVYGTGAGNDALGYRGPYKDGQTGEFNNRGYLESQKFSPTLNLSLGLGEATVTSITNYTNFSYRYGEDCDSTPVDNCGQLLGQNLKQYSEELRINGSTVGLNYTAGVYILDVKQR